MSRKLERGVLVLLGVAVGAVMAWAGLRLLPAAESEPGPGAEAVITDPQARQDARERQLARAEERFRADMNLAFIGLMRLLDFREFAEIGADVSLIVPVSAGADRVDVLEAGARRGVRVPRIVVDAEARRRWVELGRRLEQLEGAVDPDVRAAFDAVRSYLREHPVPSSTDLATISGSEWSRPSTVDRWVDLNDSLAAAVGAVMNRFGAGS